MPGGKKNKDDVGFKAAAMREMNEEILFNGMEEVSPKQLNLVFSFMTGIFNWKTYHHV